MKSLPLWLFLLHISVVQMSAKVDKPAAEVIFEQRCGICHDQAANPRVPTREALQQKSQASIRRALTTGAMRQQGSSLSATELTILAAWLGKNEPSGPDRNSLANRCEVSPALPLGSSAPGWYGWGNGLNNTRFQAAEATNLDRASVGRLQLKWAFGFPGDTTIRSQPAVYNGRVFIGAQSGAVYSLDGATGCVYWALDAAAAVRTGITIGNVNSKELVFFGDGSGRVYGADASTGKLIWERQTDDHRTAVITGTPALYESVLYVPVASMEEGAATDPAYTCCSFRGSVLAIDAATGVVRWKTYTIDRPAEPGPATKRGAKTMGPSGAGIWTAPTLDIEKKVVYVTTGNNYSTPTTATSDAVLALSMSDGKILWSKQFTPNDAYNVTCRIPDKGNCPDNEGEDTDFAAPALLTKLKNGRRVLLLGQKSGMLYAADPDRDGEVIWQAKVGRGHTISGIQASPATDGTKVYVARSDFIYERHRDPSGKRIVTKIDPESGGGMFAYLLENGELLWYAPPASCGDRRPCSPAQQSAVSALPGVAFAGSVDGHLRAYDSQNGSILWDYDTVREYRTVNGVAAKGGSLEMSGPAIAGGLLFAVSGYGDLGGIPGNVLLAFGN